MGLAHGGNITAASRHFGIPEPQWLDLSTGINPFAYPVPQSIPAQVWQRLPYREEQTISAAADYFGCRTEQLLPIPGSQFAVSLLPTLFPGSRVAIPEPGYREHAAAWQREGHRLHPYHPGQADRLELQIKQGKLDRVLVINPNNPSCDLISKDQLSYWRRLLEYQGGTLIIDEAFIDTDPQQSLADECGTPGLILLRSFGKFFGLAGLRLGFILGSGDRINAIRQLRGPWTVNGPALWVAEQALGDRRWQEQTRSKLKQSAEQLFRYLEQRFAGQPVRLSRTDFFVSMVLAADRAQALYHHFGSHGILVRQLPLDRHNAAIRIGLVPGQQAWNRFTQAIELFQSAAPQGAE